MLFTSLSYLFFLSLTAVAYYLFPGRFRCVWLVVASVAYYLSFIPIFFALIGVLVIGNFFGGRWIAKASQGGRGKKVLVVVIVLNVVVLAFFKYFHFLFPGLRVDLYFVDWFYRVDPITRMIIPLGLSYLIFTVISYHPRESGGDNRQLFPCWNGAGKCTLLKIISSNSTKLLT